LTEPINVEIGTDSAQFLFWNFRYFVFAVCFKGCKGHLPFIVYIRHSHCPDSVNIIIWPQVCKLIEILFKFFLCVYFIQLCFTCTPSDSTVSEDAGIEHVATLPLTVRRSNPSATSHPQFLTKIFPKKNLTLDKVPLDRTECGWDLAERLDLEHLAVIAEVAIVLGSIPTSSDSVESEGRQMKQCW
jgi:hypothetical protein